MSDPTTLAERLRHGAAEWTLVSHGTYATQAAALAREAADRITADQAVNALLQLRVVMLEGALADMVNRVRFHRLSDAARIGITGLTLPELEAKYPDAGLESAMSLLRPTASPPPTAHPAQSTTETP